jgi:protein tyrosine phosphatase
MISDDDTRVILNASGNSRDQGNGYINASFVTVRQPPLFVLSL